MTVLRCTAKLLKKLKINGKPGEPDAQENPLGEWYADIETWRRQAFVVMINARTGVVLMLPGNAAGLKNLLLAAAKQFLELCGHFGVSGAGVEQEAAALAQGFAIGPTGNRSLLGSINERKLAGQLLLERGSTLGEVAEMEWTGLFRLPGAKATLGERHSWSMPHDLVVAELMPQSAH